MRERTTPKAVDLSRIELKEYVSIEKFNADNEKIESLTEDLAAYAAGTDYHLASHDEAIGRLETDVESKADIADVTQHKKTVASKSQSGHVLIGDGIRVDNEGRISVESGGLEPATTSKIGGVIIGGGIRVDNTGRVSFDIDSVKSDSTTSSSSDTLATSKAVKTVMDRANEAFTSADNGKKAIRQAIIGVDDGVNVPTNPSFDELAKAIGSISTGAKFAEGVSNLIYGKYHEDSTNDVHYIEISGLDFEPELLLAVGMGKQYRVLEVTYIYHKGGVKYNDEGEIEYTEMYYNTSGRATRVKKRSGTVSFGYLRANLGITTSENLAGEPIKWVAIGGLSE